MAVKELIFYDENASEQFGKNFASTIKQGDIIALYGDLGAGKTTLARAIIRTLMQDKKIEIPSPSFAIVQPYENKKISILHVDLYRINDENEIDELGLFDDKNAIILVEWPQNSSHIEAIANWQIYIEIEPTSQARNIRIIGETKRLNKLID